MVEVTNKGVHVRVLAAELLAVPRLDMLAYLVDDPIRLGTWEFDGNPLVIDRKGTVFVIKTCYGIRIAVSLRLNTVAFRRVWNAAYKQRNNDLLVRLAKTDAAADALTILALGKVAA